VRAYKCLRPGRVGPFSGYSWPLGEWVEGEGAMLCTQGVHACRTTDLPFWLTQELWEIELDGQVRQERRKLVADRGRLVQRVEGWNGASAVSFAEDCTARAKQRAEGATGEHAELLRELVGDAAANAVKGEAALVGYIAARSAEVDGGVDGYMEERLAQARWLAAELRLDPP
jgi:hypothetical protein